ncbi:hypothetical protein [Halobacteriovorax sp. JY17]|uniref:hypothetical protein n=1 Tax=Halobacteriovorax sp. JY17 TaxID=2014617 RepID=UPI000C56FD99|nr:hypothetical protein [Halobacteriovorax sp. JY17]PIK14757.1 MAG: hypothetical protein CES88_10485 [Halobacteriovorax sp. JY17]
MKKLLIIIILLIPNLALSKEFTCSELKEREISINSQTKIKVNNLNGVCSFSVETSSDSRKFNYSDKEFKATREWIFQTNGKILIHNSYGTGPTDSSGTSYKGYQLFPNNHQLKLITNDDGSFSMKLANGANVFFNEDGSINKSKTKDLKLKDEPIKIPNIPRDKSSTKYEEIDHLSYSDGRKSSIRVYHRQLYAAATSKSIGLETSRGMYIPLGTEMGKTPGNSTTAEYTLYGVDDKKLCKQRMPAHYFFNYLVRCSVKSPNQRCACKYSEKEAQSLFSQNSLYDKEIKDIRWKLATNQFSDSNALNERLRELQSLYNPKLYSEIYFTCSLDKENALAFIAGKKISGDNREVEGVSVKETTSILDSLSNSGKCRELKKAYQDCSDCFEKEILKNESIENQEKLIQKVLDQI